MSDGFHPSGDGSPRQTEPIMPREAIPSSHQAIACFCLDWGTLKLHTVPLTTVIKHLTHIGIWGLCPNWQTAGKEAQAHTLFSACMLATVVCGELSFHRFSPTSFYPVLFCLGGRCCLQGALEGESHSSDTGEVTPTSSHIVPLPQHLFCPSKVTGWINIV